MISYNPMAMKCEHCGKGIMVGHNVSHAKNRTRKVFKPNLHSTRTLIMGVSRRVKLCTKCLRTLKRGVAKEKELLASKKSTLVSPEAPQAPAVA